MSEKQAAVIPGHTCGVSSSRDKEVINAIIQGPAEALGCAQFWSLLFKKDSFIMEEWQR